MTWGCISELINLFRSKHWQSFSQPANLITSGPVQTISWGWTTRFKPSRFYLLDSDDGIHGRAKLYFWGKISLKCPTNKDRKSKLFSLKKLTSDIMEMIFHLCSYCSAAWWASTHNILASNLPFLLHTFRPCYKYENWTILLSRNHEYENGCNINLQLYIVLQYNSTYCSIDLGEHHPIIDFPPICHFLIHLFTGPSLA